MNVLIILLFVYDICANRLSHSVLQLRLLLEIISNQQTRPSLLQKFAMAIDTVLVSLLLKRTRYPFRRPRYHFRGEGGGLPLRFLQYRLYYYEQAVWYVVYGRDWLTLRRSVSTNDLYVITPVTKNFC